MHRHFGAMHTSLSHLFYLEVTIQPYNFETMGKVGSIENKGTLIYLGMERSFVYENA